MATRKYFTKESKLEAVRPLEAFADIIGRHFRQPREGLGNDSSPTAHMWRTIIDPNKPL